MSPRVADRAVADALVEVGARLIHERVPLSTRRLASEIGTSTSAVYTHFGSMDELRAAIRKTGFERLAEHLKRVEFGDDPVADLVKQGWAYCQNGKLNADMYWAMFMEQPGEGNAEVGLYTFEMLVEGVQRAIDAGRFKDLGAWDMATRLWAATHGTVSLYLAGMFDEDKVDEVVAELARALFISFGDDPARTDASFKDAGHWIVEQLAS